MQYLTQKLFAKKVNRLALLACLLPQLLRILINYIYEYSVSGNVHYSAWETPVTLFAEFLGSLSVYAVMGILLYSVFLHDIRGGGEWVIGLCFLFGLSYFLIFYIGDLYFGLAAALVTFAVMVFAFFFWTKFFGAVRFIALAALCLPVLGGILVLSAAGEPSGDELIYNAMYGLLNLGTDFLVLLLLIVLSGVSRHRAIARGKGECEITIHHPVSLRHPVTRMLFLADLFYLLPTFVQYILNNREDITEYGWPVNGGEWWDLLFPYLILLVYFLFGYVVMLLTASYLETSFHRSEKDAAVIGK